MFKTTLIVNPMVIDKKINYSLACQIDLQTAKSLNSFRRLAHRIMPQQRRKMQLKLPYILRLVSTYLQWKRLAAIKSSDKIGTKYTFKQSSLALHKHNPPCQIHHCLILYYTRSLFKMSVLLNK